MAPDTEMRDADAIEEEKLQYNHGGVTEQELDEKYPNRPHNHSKTLPFHELLTTLFNPLLANRKKPPGAAAPRRKTGPAHMTPNEIRHSIIERFISRWRQKVGNDFYPALRLIIPEKDRDRAMYGLKEKTIAKLIVRVIGIDKKSEDALALLNWKLPGHRVSASAGDFAARCFEVLTKRPIRSKAGDLTVGQVNAMLDELSLMSKEEEQLHVFEDFYRKMNPEELMWLIRMILRQMKIGATEKTLLDVWHKDAESLFNVSSSLRRVCWELYDPELSLHGDQSQIALMSCFQPELAGFTLSSFQKLVEKMKPDPDDDVFWIEEKLDGERMQLHMAREDSGKVRFSFWSRKAKDYTYLYGSGFDDDNAALTRHLTKAFHPSIRNIILDGEMVTWDMSLDAIVAFGTLKTAAISEQKNPFSDSGRRPLFRVFDCLYVNDKPLTRYTLRDRRKALEASIQPVHRRMEIHSYTEGRTVDDIKARLSQVVAEASEGLVVKNPRSMYKHERTEDWIKVKPEYMSEYGEDLDCLIIGGYFGSGSRGGRLSSFLCGLKVDENSKKCWSFFKVGGGMAAGDYAEIYHMTDGKWKDWNAQKPPDEYIELAGKGRQFEKPDQWIKPEDSIVVAVKAASVSNTDQFRTGYTLRFPRFKSIRKDRDWDTALSVKDFFQLKNEVEQKHEDNKFELDTTRKTKRAAPKRRKKPLEIAGNEVANQYAGPDTEIFKGLTFFVLPGTNKLKKSKADLEALVKSNGGNIVQTHTVENVICIGDSRILKAASIIKGGKHNIVRAQWLLDCVEQHQIDSEAGRSKFVLPYEPCHMFHTVEDDVEMIAANVDEFGDSYTRDLTVQSLAKLCESMADIDPSASFDFYAQLESHGIDLDESPGSMFRRTVVYFDAPEDDNLDAQFAQQVVQFGNGTIANSLGDKSITHVIVGANSQASRLKEIRSEMSSRRQVPRVVDMIWVLECWKEKTMLDEEKYVP
ncbi:DNA ligase [Microthyrium microscopicum]|uniref:DNA ligase n=1 Tax=Microthyrium microscopicum TaxID=703497 RepID=A0A6A6UCZ1_9PEZI|nr:DNA ligase [Microthyrium microscopicum]